MTRALKFIFAVSIMSAALLPAVAQIPSGYVQTTMTVPQLANGYFEANWTNLSSSPQLGLLGCVSTFQQTVGGKINSYGSFTTLIADTNQICPTPSTWTFTFTFSCPAPSTGPGAFMLQIPISGGGGTEDITSEVTAALPTNPCSGSGSGPVIEVNSVPISPASPANFVDTSSVTWAFVGGQIQATAASSSGCGPVAGDNTSTDCGYGNRAGDTASIPAYVQSYGQELLGANSATEMVVSGDTSATGASGNDGVILGDHEAPYTSMSNTVSLGNGDLQGTSGANCTTLSTVVAGNSNVPICQGSRLEDVLALGDTTMNFNAPNTSHYNDVIALGDQSMSFNSAGSSLTSTGAADVVAIGDAAAGNVTNPVDVVALGDYPLVSANNTALAVSDMVVIGDTAANGMIDGASVVVAIGLNPFTMRPGISGPAPTEGIAIGDSAGDNSRATDVIAIGDTALGSLYDAGSSAYHDNTGHDVIAIGNHAAQANSTGTDNIAIGDYAGCVGCTNTAIANANTTGSHNVWIGDTAGPGTTSQLSNTIAVGYQAQTGASNQTVIGNASITSLKLFGCPSGQSAYDDGSGTCYTPGGGSGISGLTAGYIPLAGSATTITANSHIDDGVSTAGVLTATEMFTVTPASGDAGIVGLASNTANHTLLTGEFNLLGSPSATVTAFAWQVPTTTNVSAGLLHVGAEASNISQLSVSLVGIADLSATGTPSSTTFLRGDNTWATPAGAGTVTSVAMTVPSWLTVAGSPVTSSGTLAVTATTGETANEFLATPNGSSGALALRTIVGADFGSLTGCGTSGYVFTPADNDCIAASGTSAFSSLTSGTNTAAAMVVGSGASLAPTGTGTIQATNIASTISAGTNVTITGSGTTGSPYSISASGSGGSGLTDRPISGTTDTLTSSQNNTANRYTSSSSVAIAVNSASSLGAGWSAMLWQQGTGNNTFTPASGLINGNSTLAFTQQGQRALMWLDSDGTDYDAALGSGVVTPGTGLSATYTAQGMTLNATGSGTVNTGTAGHIGYYAGTGTAISGNPHLDDGATTAGTVTSSEPVNVSGAIATTAIAEAAAPTGVDTDSGGSVPASTGNQSVLTCIDVSGKYTTLGKNQSGAVTSAGGSSVIVWTFSIPTGCGTAYLWMRNISNFAYYSVVTGTSFTQTAAATTYTPASSYPVGGAYPINNTTGSVSVAGGALTFLGGPSGGSHIDYGSNYSIRIGWSGYTFGIAANTTDSASPMMAVTTTKFVSQGAGQFSWAPSNNLGVGTDTSLCRNAAGVVGVGSGSTCGSNGGLTSAVTIAGGTKFTTSGCSISSTTGGASAGVFTLGANSCTAVVTMNGATGWTAPNGWTCQAHDRTAPTVLIGGESSSTTTTASFTIPAGAGATDVISFSCTAY